jgi:DNA-binding PadR family transcriptional regulator
MSSDDLTTTSYAILGLLAIQDWSTYELAQQMERSLSYFWPRAQSRIYEEPKRLVSLGLAKATSGSTGRRQRTTYAITAKGRRALARWLAVPGNGPVVEFEALLKVFFGDHSGRNDVLTNVAAIRDWADQQDRRNIEFARAYVESGGPFPERLAFITLIGKFLTDFADMVGEWAQWAAAEVSSWPANERPPAAWDVLHAVAARPITTQSR